MSPPVTRLGIPVTFFAFVVTSLMFRAISANVGGTWCQLAVTQCPPFVTWVFLRVLGVTFVSVLVVTPRALFRATPINGSVTSLSPGVTWVSLCVLGVMCVPSQSLLSPLFRATPINGSVTWLSPQCPCYPWVSLSLFLVSPSPLWCSEPPPSMGLSPSVTWLSPGVTQLPSGSPHHPRVSLSPLLEGFVTFFSLVVTFVLL